MADLKKFLSDTAGQINLSLMDPARQARLKQLQILDTGYPEQLKWDINAALANPTDAKYDMTDAEWEKIYMSIQMILSQIKGDAKLMAENKAAKKLVEDFYGTDKIIKEFQPSATATRLIDPNVTDFSTYLSHPNIRVFLESNIESDDLDKVIDSLNATPPSYQTNSKILHNIRTISATIINGSNDNTLPNTPLLGTSGITVPNFYRIYENITKQEPPETQDRDDFRDAIYTGAGNPISDDNIIRKLAENPKAMEAFVEKDSGGVGKAIAKGIKGKNYKEGKYELVPMDEQSLNLFQKAENVKDHVVNEMLGKLTSRHKRHPYFMDKTAKPIMDSLFDKQKFDMTKGLDDFMSKADAIKGDMKENAPMASGDLDWFVKSLKSIKGTLPKEFKGALKDGANLQAVVNALINRAQDEGEWDKLKTAMECLAMMRYSSFTSGALNALSKTPVSLLGDNSLSWNKNEGVQFATKAFDLAAKSVLKLGVGALTLGYNKWQDLKSTYNNASDEVQLMTNAERYLKGTKGSAKTESDLVSDLGKAEKKYKTIAQASNSAEFQKKAAEKEWKQAEMNMQVFRQNEKGIMINTAKQYLKDTNKTEATLVTELNNAKKAYETEATNLTTAKQNLTKAEKDLNDLRKNANYDPLVENQLINELTNAKQTHKEQIKSASKANQEFRQAKINLDVFNQKDKETINPDTRDPEANLTKRQNAMAFWNYINSPIKSGFDINIFQSNKSAQNYQNEEIVIDEKTNKKAVRKEHNFSAFAANYYENNIRT